MPILGSTQLSIAYRDYRNTENYTNY